jgi:hypothetical protein
MSLLIKFKKPTIDFTFYFHKTFYLWSNQKLKHMFKPNLVAVLIAALVPMLTGFIWYHKKVFGSAWMKAAGMDEEKMKGANMALIFGLAYLLSFFLAFAMQFIVIHQSHVYSVVMGDASLNDASSELSIMLKNFMEKYGNNFRTFKHGTLHGTIAGITVALPILGTNALFERKSFKYVAINAGYWILTMALMGGVVCAMQ